MNESYQLVLGAPGVASAFLQVVLLGPNSRFPNWVNGAVDGGGQGSAGLSALGWTRPPAEGCESNTDLVHGATIGVALDDLLLLERPTAAMLEWEANGSDGSSGGGMPEDAPELLRRLQGRVGGLGAPLAVIVRRALASRLYPVALTRELGLAPVRGMLLYGPPGCGKTLLAREITSALGARKPKIVNVRARPAAATLRRVFFFVWRVGEWRCVRVAIGKQASRSRVHTYHGVRAHRALR